MQEQTDNSPILTPKSEPLYMCRCGCGWMGGCVVCSVFVCVWMCGCVLCMVMLNKCGCKCECGCVLWVCLC